MEAMLFPCFLLSLLFTVACCYSPPKHSADVSQSPTCEQLRAFWYEINQMTQAVEMTNEIPILPLQLQNAMDRLLPFKNSQRGKSYKKLLKDKSPYILDIMNPTFRYSMPEQFASSPNHFVLSQQTPLNDPVNNGVFGEFHELVADEQSLGSSKLNRVLPPDHHHPITKPEVIQVESSPDVSTESKKNHETEFILPQWGSPEDVDTFGSFIDVDVSSPYLPMTRTPKGVKEQTSAISPQACNVLMNTDCRTKDDCFCKGWRKLTCIHGKCLSHGHHEDMEAKYGIWHDGPIPHSELQFLARRKKRSYKSIFM